MMEVDEFPAIDPNLDYTKILPIHQKRIIAFINHFITNTVSFLNTFAQSCESRLMEFEHKMQKVEASLLILESQLASISGLSGDSATKGELGPKAAEQQNDSNTSPELPELNEESKPAEEDAPAQLRLSPDPALQRFFKMVQVGVPLAAVKHKMAAEGLDPSILERTENVGLRTS